MPSCCLSAVTCLAERARTMRINGPHGWQMPCMDCVEGAARQMDRHKPEPDKAPSHGMSPRPRCAECGKKIAHGNITGCCKACGSLYGDEKKRRASS